MEFWDTGHDDEVIMGVHVGVAELPATLKWHRLVQFGLKGCTIPDYSNLKRVVEHVEAVEAWAR